MITVSINIGPEKASYMMRYDTKGQGHVANEALIHPNVFDEAAAKYSDDTESVATGTKKIRSILSTLASAQEVKAPQAGLYIERDSMMYLSRMRLSSSMFTALLLVS